jgi:hypothetical protein
VRVVQQPKIANFMSGLCSACSVQLATNSSIAGLPHLPSYTFALSGALGATSMSGLDQVLPGTNNLVIERVSAWEDPTRSTGAGDWFDEKYRNREFGAVVALGSGNLVTALHLRK